MVLSIPEGVLPGGDGTLDLGRTFREPGVQVHVNRSLALPRLVHGEGAGAWRYACGVGQGSVETQERIVLACPNGRCDERVVLAGRHSLWYGRGRPEVFLCEGCGGRLALAARIVLDEGHGRR